VGAYKTHLKNYLTLGELTTLKVNLLIRLTTIEHFNTSVCHCKKGGDCWNKICLTLPLSFDDNKVLKNVN